MPADLSQGWGQIPEGLRGRLSLASTGWRHLAQTGALALQLARAEVDGAQRARLFALAADLLLWAFGENPLYAPLAAEITSAANETPELPLPQASRAALAAVASHWRAPGAGEGGMAYFERLASRRDTARLADFLAGQTAKDPAGLFWRDKALALALFCGPGEVGARLEASALAGLSAIDGLAPVAANLDAQAAFFSGETTSCREALGLLGPAFGPGFASGRAGLALLAAGDEATALPLLRHSLARAPWQASLAFVAADAASGTRRALAPPPGPVVVMLYTWNKAADLDATLASLFASELCGAQVLALDNGSTDGTAQVLDAWTKKSGGRLCALTLPVNIGAPAARNWLAATPQALAAQSLVYLDDDVTLPPDWLLRLGAAQKAWPEAGVVGCKVADHQSPHLLQNVAGHLVVPADAPEDRPDMDFRSLTPNPFRLLDAHLQGPDWGLFDFVGPCASVTGCCHLFTRAALAAPSAQGGQFSLALGPSQYDDFERDLRMLAGGRNAVYQGHLRVRHRKRSGLAAQSSAVASGASANANRYKMQTMHPRAEIAGFIAAQALRLGEAVAGALGALDRAGESS